MYSVILIDDEPWALDGILNAFEWDKAGLSVIGKFTDSIEALDYIFRQPPDIVFTDIRMPELDGLELIKRVKQAGINTEFIMVSGFADFTFAREALRLGALDYILKPLDSEETDSILKKVVLQLEERNICKDLEIFEHLLDNQMSALDFINLKGSNCINEYFMVIVLGNTNNDFINQILPGSINKIQLKLGTGKFLYVINEASDELDNMCGKLTRNNSHYILGISSIRENVEFIPKMIREADIAAYNNYFCFNRTIFRYQNADFKTIKKYFEKICFEINSHKYEELKNHIMELPELAIYEKLGIEEVTFLWNQLVSLLTNEFGCDLKDFDVYYMEYYQVANRFYSITAFSEFICGILDEVLAANNFKMTNSGVNDKFVEIIAYINNNYNENLQLSTLANKFYFNFSYFCSTFKKVTGQSFSDYLTDIRMKQARYYLENTSKSTNEICIDVGYHDYFYFSKVFKKRIGITPAQYRISKK